MDQISLAEQLALADHQHSTDILGTTTVPQLSLAHALKNLYVDRVSADPAIAGGAARALSALAQINSDPEIQALATWTRAMASLQLEGHADQASALIDQAAEQFRAIGQEATAAATQATKIYALAIQGAYDEAVACGQQALDILLAHGDMLTAGKIEQNLGNVNHRRGRLTDAAQFYGAAREHFTALDDQRMLAFAENGLANVLALQNHSHEAGALYEQALGRAEAIGAEITQAEIECNLGCLALDQGLYDRALRFLEQSRRRYATLAMPHESLIAELELADAYLECNIAAQAEAIYARIAPKLADLHMSAEYARALANHGRACAALGDHAQANELVKEALEAYRAEGNQIGLALVALTSAQLDGAAGAFEQAIASAEAAETILSELGLRSAALQARWIKGDALRQAGDPSARTVLESTLAESRHFTLPQLIQRCLTSLGLLAISQADPQTAEQAFTEAIETIEALRAPLPAEEFRAAFLADKLTPYSELVRLYLSSPERERDRTEEALIAVERARARTLLDSMHGSQRQPNPADAPLLAQREALRENLNWLYRQITRLPEADTPTNQALAEVQQTILVHETNLQQLERQLQHQASDTAAELPAFTIKEIQAELGAKRALIEYFFLDDEIIAIVVTDQTVQTIRQLASVSAVTNNLSRFQFQLGSLRSGAGLEHAHAAILMRRIQHYLGQLYDQLLARLLPVVDDRHLLISPHRALYYAPFHALYNGEQYAINEREICITPSAAIWLQAARRERPQPHHAVLAGVPDKRAPLLRDEVLALAPLFESADILLDDHATLAAVQQHAPAADILHLACHGQFRPDNPAFSALHLADGRLLVRDAAAFELNCSLAVLSACETAVAEIAPGDELIGLASSFLGAGARTLIASLWTVDDHATTELMSTFYKALLSGNGPAAALRLAQRAQMERTPHPFHWAPFIAFGAPDGSW